MKYSPIFQNKMKFPQKFRYNTNILRQNNNQNIFGFKQNRDITPFRKYNNVKKTKSNNNLLKKKTNSNKQINIEGDLISSSNFPLKRARTPLNKSMQDNFNKNNNLKSVSLNNSIKLNKPKLIPFKNNSNKLYQNSPLAMNFNNNKLLNKSYNLNNINKTNRTKAQTNIFNLTKSSNFSNPKSLKLNRSITPNPKSKIKLGLSKSNSKLYLGSNLKQNKTGTKSPFQGFKKKNILVPNTLQSKLLYPKNNISSHYSNKFKSKNIFANQKNKPKVFTYIINQNYSSTSSKNNLQDGNSNKEETKTNHSNYSDNKSINNIIINNSNNNINLNIQNKYNQITKIESNNSINISGISINNNQRGYNNTSPLSQVENIKLNNVNINIKNAQENNISKEIRKKILCMHEFSKTGYAGEDEKKVNQDNYFVFRNFVNNVDYIFMAVCDGHGAVGQEISSFLKENLPIDLNHALRDAKSDILKDDISSIITDIFIKENTI